VVGLIGPPLTRRRFLLELNDRVETLGTSKVLIGFYGLLGFSEDKSAHSATWIDAFEEDFKSVSASEETPVHLSTCRQCYYVDALHSLAESDEPRRAAWPLLRTWLDIKLNSKNALPNAEVWDDCLENLGLTLDTAEQKIEALDAYLDNLEIVIETWADEYGI
jgi:hypothetical protein